MAKCFQEIQKHGKMNFDLEFILMDPGYNKKHINKEKRKVILKLFFKN